jgi:hypothetical protein
MLLKIPEYLFSIRVGDLGIDFGVLDVAMAQVIGHVLDAAAGFQEVDGDGVAQSMDGSAGNACGLRVGLEEMLHHAFLERALPSGEEVLACISPDTEVCSQGFCGVAPEGLLTPDAVLEASDPDAVLFEVDVVERELGGLVHPQAVMIDQRKEGPVARGVDRSKEAFELILGEIFGK